jgi:hypothetical protein
MSDLRVRTDVDPAARRALDEAMTRADLADDVVPEPPSCRTPMAVQGEATWRRRLRVARSWWCAFVSGLG